MVDLRDIVARFCAVYPGEFRDGAIPWALFWVLYERLHVVLAMDRVNQTRAVGLAWGGEGTTVMIQSDYDEAYPHG